MSDYLNFFDTLREGIDLASTWATITYICECCPWFPIVVAFACLTILAGFVRTVIDII